MAHGLSASVRRGSGGLSCKGDGKAGIGSRRIFAPQFKLQVLDSYRNDVDCKGNQRATARKYGIHRRQIQKWLQVENNLRSSVLKGKGEGEVRKCGIEVALRKSEIEAGRQRDDVSSEAFPVRQVGEDERGGGADAGESVRPDKRVPDIPQPLWSPPERADGSPQLYSPQAPVAGAQPPCGCPEAMPLDFTTHSRYTTSPLGACFPVASAPIDLSLKKTYPRVDTPAFATPSPPPPQPVPIPAEPLPEPHIWDLSTKRLKRPHEDDHNHPYAVSSTSDPKTPPPIKPVKLFKPYLLDETSYDPPKPSPPYDPYLIPDPYYYNNNNNNDYSLYKDDPYPIPQNYYPLDLYHPLYHDMPKKPPSPTIKQRQSYSLDFKLSAIQCYYSDEICKGNQRAVATKYKIHRRQVQKWLKQEDQLRQRIETTKHMHIVR